MAIYFKLCADTQSPESIRALIAQIDLIVSSLLTTALTSVTQGKVAEYEIDTGQTRQKVRYRTLGEVNKAISEYQTLRIMYQNLLTGRTFRLVDQRNFR